MPYLTVNRAQRTFQLSFDDLFKESLPRYLGVTKDTRDTTTYFAETIRYKTAQKVNSAALFSKIVAFNEKYDELINSKDKSTLYKSFKIPKRTGGFREIDSPNEALREALYDLKDILEKDFWFTYHTCAFSYIRGRSTIDAVKRHQGNESRWVLKTDLSKFFPNSTPEFVFKMLYETFPLCEFIRNPVHKAEFERALSLCFLRNGLPQGTPTSPMLTNQMMIPLDYTIAKYCREHHICYTRYADDMDFSSKYSFRWTDVVSAVDGILKNFGAPFTFNREKTHYGSTAGRNWMLGVMLNKDGDITVGHENKKTLKVSLFSFANSAKNGTPWSVEDTQHLQGIVAYYTMVEGEKISEIVDKYSDKTGIDIKETMKRIINGTYNKPSVSSIAIKK